MRLLLAPPGAGKGTQGEWLAAWSGVRHIAAGDLLRAEAQAGGRLGREIAAYQARGDLVPYYTERGILVAVDADQPPETVTADIQAWLSGLARAAGR